mgnify:CR=1 FL=1
MTLDNTLPTSEPSKPDVGRGPVPFWLAGVSAGLLAWAVWYMGTHSGAFDPGVYEPYKTPRQLVEIQPVARADAFVARGRRVFETVCALCHGADGAGQPGRAPPLAGSEWVRGAEDRLVRITLHGLSGPVTVGTQTWNLSMPALGGALSAEDLAAALTHIRQAWGNSSPAVTAERVRAIQAATTGRAKPWTAAELESSD